MKTVCASARGVSSQECGKVSQTCCGGEKRNLRRSRSGSTTASLESPADMANRAAVCMVRHEVFQYSESPFRRQRRLRRNIESEADLKWRKSSYARLR